MSTEKPLPPPPPSRGKHREAWVGLFVVAGILATVILLAVMTDAALFRGRYIVTTNVPNAGGIRKGDPVQMRGVNIGRIIGFGIGQKDVDVRLEIEGEYKIPKDSRVEVKAAGLLGGMVAEVIPGASPETIGLGRPDPGRERHRPLRQDGHARRRGGQGGGQGPGPALGRDGEGPAGRRDGRPPVAREPAGDPEGAARRAARALRQPQALRRGHGEGDDRPGARAHGEAGGRARAAAGRDGRHARHVVEVARSRSSRAWTAARGPSAS